MNRAPLLPATTIETNHQIECRESRRFVSRRQRNCWQSVLIFALLAVIGVQPVSAQVSDGGFKNKAPAAATGDERTSQTNLWVLEVHFKSLRSVKVPLPDPKTGEIRDENILYFVYKVLQRDLGKGKDESDTSPKNSFDPEVTPPLFVPEVTLVTHDNGQKIYDDVLLPAAQKVIMRREQLRLKNSVEIVGAIPEITPAGDEKEKALFGVAMWRGVDPAADEHTVVMAGFSNGYKLVRGPVTYQTLMDRVKAGKMTFSDQVWDGKTTWRAASEVHNLFDARKPPPKDPDNNIWFYTITPERIAADEEQPLTWRKTLIQRYWRPGDEFDPREREFRESGDPEWIYQPDQERIPVVKGTVRPTPAKKPAAAKADNDENAK